MQQNPSLLIVDDEEGPRIAIKSVFSRDYTVQTASSAREGLQAIQENPDVGVAILDIQMADRNGIELLGDIKKIRPDIEVMMLTAFETLETAQAAIRLGACDYQTKPFNIPKLRESVKRAFELRSSKVPESRVQELVQQLAQTKDQEMMLRELNHLYAAAIHDMNNPLTVLMGWTGIIRNKLESKETFKPAKIKELKDSFDLVSDMANNLATITRRSSRLLRRGLGDGEWSNPFEAAHAAVRVAQRHDAKGESHLLIDIPSDASAAVFANENDIEQLVVNLIVNAFQSAHRKVEVTVRANRESGPDLLAANFKYDVGGLNQKAQDRDFFHLVVQDDGDGIPDAIREKIFDLQFSTKADEGFGIGLASVAQITEYTGGSVRVESSPSGSSFHIYFPLRPAHDDGKSWRT
ncbi:MAG: hypothetical protein SynsKO_15960 [Synoicihabitans sp.]